MEPPAPVLQGGDTVAAVSPRPCLLLSHLPWCRTSCPGIGFPASAPWGENPAGAEHGSICCPHFLHMPALQECSGLKPVGEGTALTAQQGTLTLFTHP